MNTLCKVAKQELILFPKAPYKMTVLKRAVPTLVSNDARCKEVENQAHSILILLSKIYICTLIRVCTEIPM